MSEGITSADEFLLEAVKAFLTRAYGSMPFKINSEIDSQLGWVPSLNCTTSSHVMAIEASEKVYPLIFRLRRAEMAEVETPIAVYCVCPEEAYLSNQRDAADLEKHGFGLFTVNSEGVATKKFAAIPIVQHITDSEYDSDVRRLPSKVKRMAKDSFDIYRGNSAAGVASISEVVEGLIMKAAKEACKRKWMSKSQSTGALAGVLVNMKGVSQFRNAEAALSGAQTFVSNYRNSSHHFPKNKKAAHRKYRDCRHGFLDGLRHLQTLSDTFKQVGLSGSL